MTHDDVLQKVASTIRETFGVPAIDITQDTTAGDVPGWDPHSHPVLMLALGRAFHVELRNLAMVENVGELVDLIAEGRQTPPQGQAEPCVVRPVRESPDRIGSERDEERARPPLPIGPLSGSDHRFSRLLTGGDVSIPYGRFDYPCRFRRYPGGRYLSVQLHGARSRKSLPIFARWNYGPAFQADVLAVCDPTLYLDDTLDCGWYLGTREQNAVDGLVAIALGCAMAMGTPPERVIFTGSSAGGFAALQAAAMIPHGKAIALNPQVDLLRFDARVVGDYVAKASGCASLEEATRCFGDRWNATNALRRATARQDGPRVVYVQNKNDSRHFLRHFTPFARVFGLSQTDPNSTKGGFMSILYDGPPKHTAESPAEVKRIKAEGIPFLLGSPRQD
jgi:acyl carrier protein